MLVAGPEVIYGNIQVAPTEVRGLLGSVNQLVICIGILAALVINVALPASSWRTMFAVASIPAALLGLGEELGSWYG